MGFLILLSLILMQASRNFSDIWLAHWISSINGQNNTVQQPNNTSELDSQFQARNVLAQAMCYFHKIISLADLSECTPYLTEDRVETQDSYYLAIYIAIAVFNSLIALLRAFAFAYAGIKAAKIIHKRLLDSVIFVRIELNAIYTVHD